MKNQILIIDDDQFILDTLKDIFIYTGYAVTAFTEINDIKATMDLCKPDLVMVDFLLQGINGGELCAQIKKNVQTQSIPVILMSAHARVMLSLGTYNCDDFLEKPFNLESLLKSVNCLLESKKARPRHTEYVRVTPQRNN